MIQVTDINGVSIYLHRDAIASVREAGASSQWHGVRSFIRTFEGKTIETREDAKTIVGAVESDRLTEHGRV